MRRNYRHITAILLAMLLWATVVPLSARAADVPSALFLSQEISVSFEPDEVYFLLEVGGTAERVKAALITLPNSTASTTLPRYVAGVRLPPEVGAASVRYSVVVIGKGSQFEVIPSRTEDLNSRPAFFGSTDTLHEAIDARKEVLASYRLQIQSQEESLRRLRQDAEVIGNFGRVTEVSDEVSRLKQEIADADKSAEILENALRRVGNASVVKYTVARESQLTRQLSELAEASKNAEAGEISRKALMEADLKDRLAIVESTRFDDFDALQRQLAELRAQRETLEREKRAASHLGAPAAPTPLPASPDVDY